jgi:hypothetical protein
MAPKAKASAPAHLVITGKVKGPPKISQDGSAIVVKKTLDDGATVEEKFPKRRVKGKQKQLQQLIPAEDVLRTIEEATDLVAEAVRADGERRVQAISSMANRLSDEQLAKYNELAQTHRDLVRHGGKVLMKNRARADKQVRQAVKVAVGAKMQTRKAKEQAQQAMSFAEFIARHVNEG